MRNEQGNPQNNPGNINIRSNPIPSSPSANKKQIIEQSLDANQGDNQQFNCRFNPPSGQPPPVSYHYFYMFPKYHINNNFNVILQIPSFPHNFQTNSCMPHGQIHSTQQPTDEITYRHPVNTNYPLQSNHCQEDIEYQDIMEPQDCISQVFQ